MWTPGQSGNPGGRPKSATALRDYALANSREMLEALVEIATDKSIAPGPRIAAADRVLDRALGKAIAVNASVEEMAEFNRMASKDLSRYIEANYGPALLELKNELAGQQSAQEEVHIEKTK
jgi:hypothetical protein